MCQTMPARSMVLKRTFTVGIVVPDTFNMFQRQLFSIIEHDLEVYGYRTLFFFIKWEPESELNCFRKLKAENLDGVIMIHEATNPDFYGYLLKSGIPVVLCPFRRDEEEFCSVHVKEDLAARAATEYLVSLGHRRIGIIAGTHFSFPLQRLTGYRAALKDAGLEYDESRVVSVSSYSPEEGRMGMRELLARGGNLSAIFAITDELAIGAIRAAFERGLSVPGDVSIIGIDDIDIASFLTPSLTTVRQPIREMGKRTAQIMHRLIGGEDISNRDTVFSHELVIRESCRAV